MDISVQDQIRLKFKDGAVCPHCGSRAVNKFGFFDGKQRYRCKECKKTFNLYTKTLLSWSHYKDKWEAFIKTMSQDLSLRQAEKQVGVSYVTLFYWRHKIMTILNETNEDKLHGTLEIMKMKLRYLDKYHRRDTMEEDPEEIDKEIEKIFEDAFGEEEKKSEQGAPKNVIFTFLFQRSGRLESYIYKENKGHRAFINDLSYNIEEHSIVCLSSNYPYRYPLLNKKIFVAKRKMYKRGFIYNADNVRKYIGMFRVWMRTFKGVSSKNLTKYSYFFKTHKVFNNMECIISSSLREQGSLRNKQAVRGELGF
jgi:transposase-like protein